VTPPVSTTRGGEKSREVREGRHTDTLHAILSDNARAGKEALLWQGGRSQAFEVRNFEQYELELDRRKRRSNKKVPASGKGSSTCEGPLFLRTMGVFFFVNPSSGKWCGVSNANQATTIKSAAIHAGGPRGGGVIEEASNAKNPHMIAPAENTRKVASKASTRKPRKRLHSARLIQRQGEEGKRPATCIKWQALLSAAWSKISE